MSAPDLFSASRAHQAGALRAIDLFAGAGGFSTGASMAGVNVVWAANHWQTAVEAHAANHPDTIHVCQDLHQADWSQVPEHDLLMASPCCQGHSHARGSDSPQHDASRSTAWAVVSAAEFHRPRFCIVENVPEFMNWQLFPAWRAAMEALGYHKDTDWVEFEVMAPTEVPEKALRVQEMVLRRSKLRLVQGSKKQYLPYARGLFDVVNEAYKDLYGVVELTDRQVDAYIKQYFGFLNVDYVKIIIDENDRVVAFGLAMPSLSRALQQSKGRLLPFGFIHLLRALKRPTQIDFLLVAVLPEYQARGLTALLMAEITTNAIKNGIRSAETNPELETNTQVQAIWKHYESRQHKRRRAFIKSLE